MSRCASLCPTSGAPFVSALASSSLAPSRALMPPALLMASTASLAPLSICCPSAADVPLSGCSEPIVIVSPEPPLLPPVPDVPGGAEPPQAASASGRAAAIAIAVIQGFLMGDSDSARPFLCTEQQIVDHSVIGLRLPQQIAANRGRDPVSRCRIGGTVVEC